MDFFNGGWGICLQIFYEDLFVSLKKVHKRQEATVEDGFSNSMNSELVRFIT
jgi:hypothetical protein